MLADDSHGIPELMVMVMLGNGFIITSMLWATILAALIDGERKRASLALLVAAAFTTFGIIHSVQPQGALYLPWTLAARELGMVMQWIAAYVLLAALLWVLPRHRAEAAKT